jgi:hypothetical protein
MNATYRPITDLEKQQALALACCTLPPATMTKRFARDLKAQVETRGEITEKQAAYLLVCCYRYRRQIDSKLVPSDPPPGYVTPRQRQELSRYQAVMEGKP